MNDCLVTKLKGVVNNDNLDILGKVTIIVNAPSSPMTTWIDVNGVVPEITVSEGITRGGNNVYPNFTGVGKIIVSDKYNLTHLSLSNKLGKLSLNSFIGTKVKTFYGNGVQGLTHLNQLPGILSNLEEIVLRNDNNTPTDVRIQVSGNISDLFPYAETLLIINFRDVNISGTMSDLGKFSSLEKVTSIVNTSIAGSLEDFVNSRRELSTPQLTGTVYFDYPSNNADRVTFNGNPITGSSTNMPLTWTADTITFDGVTINA